MQGLLCALLFVFAGLAGLAFGQSSSGASAPHTGPAPADTIRSMTTVLSGTWTTREKYEALGPSPAGGAGTGTVVWRPGPGGFTLHEEYRAQSPLGELVGFGIIWWDTSRQLQHLWCINVNPDGCEMFPPSSRAGPRWDGKQLVIDTEVSIAGRRYAWHEAIVMTSATSFQQTVDLGETPKNLRRWLTSQATKVQP